MVGHESLKAQLGQDFGDHQFDHRMKAESSIAEKIVRKGVEPKQMQDISGFRIRTTSHDDTVRTVEKFKAKYGDRIIKGSEDDYLTKPKGDGYRAYHAAIMENGEPHEVQIRSERMHEWAETYHPIYKNEPWCKGLRDEPAVKAYFRDAADIIDKRDRGLSAPMPECPGQIRKVGLCL